MRALISAFLLVLAVTGHAVCQEHEFSAANIAITPPDGWKPISETVTRPGLVVAFGNGAGTKLVMVLRDDQSTGRTPAMDEKFEREFEVGVEASGGGKRRWGRFVEIAGVKGYERLGEVDVDGRPTSVWMRTVFADQTHYSLQGMRVDGDASEDPEIRGSLESFRFLKPPTASPSATPDSEAYRAGYLAGRIAMWVLLALVIVIVIRKATRKRSPGNRPPPLPPRAARSQPGKARPPSRPATASGTPWLFILLVIGLGVVGYLRRDRLQAAWESLSDKYHTAMPTAHEQEVRKVFDHWATLLSSGDPKSESVYMPDVVFRLTKVDADGQRVEQRANANQHQAARQRFLARVRMGQIKMQFAEVKVREQSGGKIRVDYTKIMNEKTLGQVQMTFVNTGPQRWAVIDEAHFDSTPE